MLVGITITSNKVKMKIITASFLASLLFMVLAIKTYLSDGDNPFFIDTSEVLSRYEPMLNANRTIGWMDEQIQKRMSVFDDSLAKVLDSLSAGNKSAKDFLEILNMESNVIRHKMVDSIGNIAETMVAGAYNQFDESVASFCQANGIEVLFGTASNFVVYGANGKADRTGALLDYMGVAHE